VASELLEATHVRLTSVELTADALTLVGGVGEVEVVVLVADWVVTEAAVDCTEGLPALSVAETVNVYGVSALRPDISAVVVEPLGVPIGTDEPFS
jgi:hypothetical protein